MGKQQIAREPGIVAVGVCNDQTTEIVAKLLSYFIMKPVNSSSDSSLGLQQTIHNTLSFSSALCHENILLNGFRFQPFSLKLLT